MPITFRFTTSDLRLAVLLDPDRLARHAKSFVRSDAAINAVIKLHRQLANGLDDWHCDDIETIFRLQDAQLSTSSKFKVDDE